MKHSHFARVILAFIILFIAAILGGCGTTSKIKNSQSEAVKLEAKEESVQKTKTTTKEVVDTNVTIKGEKAEASKPIDAILKGDTLTASTNGTKVKTWFNPSTGNLHAEAETQERTIPIKSERMLTTETSAENKSELKAETETEQSAKETERTGLSFGWQFWICLIILLVLVYLF